MRLYTDKRLYMTSVDPKVVLSGEVSPPPRVPLWDATERARRGEWLLVETKATGDRLCFIWEWREDAS